MKAGEALVGMKRRGSQLGGKAQSAKFTMSPRW